MDPLTATYISAAWPKATLKHENALGRGVHPKVASEMLGHATVSITLDVYSRVTPTMQRQAAEALDAVLSGA